MEITGTPTLQELRRIMTEHPADMDDEILGWAIGCLELRIDLIDGRAVCLPDYQLRLRMLRNEDRVRAGA